LVLVVSIPCSLCSQISQFAGDPPLMQLHLFGAATPSGESLRLLTSQVLPKWEVQVYSRRLVNAHRADFYKPEVFQPVSLGNSAFWISFGPIWLFAPFLEQLAQQHPERLKDLRGLIACSSSSVLTKRFAANNFDRALVARIISAEDQLLATCRRLDVPCRILRPSLIYGQVGPYGDRNISRLLALMRRLPLILLPSHSGLRQPIHASQLAAVALHLAQQMLGPGLNPALPERIAVGGDSQISYKAMLHALQQALPANYPARNSCICEIPNRLFFLLAAPLLLRSPKAFEAVLRIGADLAGFTPSHHLLDQAPQPFPVLPLAL
jgi:hypothetical protein